MLGIRFPLELIEMLGVARGADMEITMRELYQEIGAIATKHVRALLGTSEVYTITQDWAKKKPKQPGYRQFAGKASDQPLILTGAMYNAVWFRVTFDGLEIGFLPRDTGGRFTSYLEDPSEPRSVGGGIDVESPGGRALHAMEIWNDRTKFVEKGVERAIPEIEEHVHSRISTWLMTTYPYLEAV